MPSPDTGLQFQHAEFPGAGRSCANCKSAVGGEYYLLGAHTLCPACAPRFAQAATPSELRRPILYGAGAALLGAIGYALISNLLNARLSLVSILVGLLVGRAVRAGAGGLGGRKLQVVAVVLTYIAITFSILPQLISGLDSSRIPFAIVIALASPFLELAGSPGGGLLNAAIIFFGLMQAWRMTRGIKAALSGPYQVGAAA